jgi:hypothetical protein
MSIFISFPCSAKDTELKGATGRLLLIILKAEKLSTTKPGGKLVK